jgi:uncharacterized protein YggE
MMRIAKIAAWMVVGAVAAGVAAAQTIQINRDNKTIAISATDEATATADIAAITVGFEIYGADSQSTYAEGGNLSQAVMEALHKTGVKDESIESSQQSLQQNRSFDEKETAEQRAKRQFLFTQSWMVSVPPQIAAEVIRVAIAAGANQSGAINWRLADRKALQAKAAENALVKAHGVADRMAEGLHVKLGALVYAGNETPNTNLFPIPRRTGPGQGFNTGGGMYMSKNLLPPPLEIRPQTIREEATVYAVFAIE